MDNKGICDEDTFSKVYLESNPVLQRFIRSKGLSVDEAADLAQEAFVKMWNNCAKVVVDKVLPFLFTTSRNLIIDRARKNNVRHNYLGSIVSSATAENPQFQLEVKEYQAKLDKVIASMKEGEREVFVLSRIEKMKYKEIAQVLGLSVKAVEKRMSNALRHLVDHGIIRKI